MKSSFTLPLQFLTLVLFHVFFLSVAAAQQTPKSSNPTNFSEETLKTFVKVNHKVKEIEHASEDQMIEAVRAENMEVQKFNELLKAQQNNGLKTSDASTEELEAFQAASRHVQFIQQNMSEEITLYVEEEMGIDLYKSVLQAYQSSPQLRSKVNNIYNY